MNQYKNVLITGCSSGLGKAIANEAIRNGYTVFATMRDTTTEKAQKTIEDLKATAKNADGEVYCHLLDVTNDDRTKELIAELEVLGGIDILVNNASISQGINAYAETLSMEQFSDTFDVNLLGVQRMITNVLPLMHERGKGLIINISSTIGRLITPFAGAYIASKFALEALSQSYYYQLTGSNVNMCIVEPAGFGTSLWDKVANFKPAQPQHSKAYKDMKIGDQTVDDFKNTFWQGLINALTSENAPDPKMVGEGVVNLFEKPTLPLRVVIDPFAKEQSESHCARLNAEIDKHQKGFMQDYGLSELTANAHLEGETTES